MGFESLSIYRMKIRNLMTCVEREKKKVFLRFHVYSAFYSHLFDRVIQQMATHQHRPQKCNKNRITAIAFGKHHLAPLIASTAATFAINPKYIKALHQQMKRLKSVRVSRLKPKHVTECCNLVCKVWWVVPVVNHMVKGHSWHIVNHFMITMQDTFKQKMSSSASGVHFLTVLPLLCVHRHHFKTVISCWTWEKMMFPRSAQWLWFTM